MKPASNSRALWLALVLLYAMPLFAQQEMMTIGIKGGAQLTSSFSFRRNTIVPEIQTQTNYVRPILGLTFEKPLSPNISIEVDALYNPEKYRFQQACFQTNQGCIGPVIDWETHGHTLEFPVIVKKYWGTNIRNRFFANAGVSVRSMTMSYWTLPDFCDPPPPTSVPFCDYILADNHGSFGFVFGGGVDFKRGPVHFYPELRYTRWLSNKWSGDYSILDPNQNALILLIGFSIGK